MGYEGALRGSGLIRGWSTLGGGRAAHTTAVLRAMLSVVVCIFCALYPEPRDTRRATGRVAATTRTRRLDPWRKLLRRCTENVEVLEHSGTLPSS